MEKLELLNPMLLLSSVKLKDLPPPVSVTLDCKLRIDLFDEGENLEVDFGIVEYILLQVQHVKELSLGPCILMILTAGALRGEPFLYLDSKCLTVIDPFSKFRVPGLAFLLLSCPMLEILKIQLCGGVSFQPGYMKVGKKFWEIVENVSLFGCLMSSLKTVEIGSLCDVRGRKYYELLKFAKFILNHARVLEKMALLAQTRQETNFANELCQKLSGVRKSSPLVVVEVARGT